MPSCPRPAPPPGWARHEAVDARPGSVSSHGSWDRGRPDRPSTTKILPAADCCVAVFRARSSSDFRAESIFNRPDADGLDASVKLKHPCRAWTWTVCGGHQVHRIAACCLLDPGFFLLDLCAVVGGFHLQKQIQNHQSCWLYLTFFFIFLQKFFISKSKTVRARGAVTYKVCEKTNLVGSAQ